MKNKLTSLLWGIALIAGGIFFLASNYRLIAYWDNNPTFWIAVLTVLSVLFLITYTINGIQEWGWLFPASICAGQALTLSLAVSRVDGAFIAFPILISVALPFLAGYLLDRTRTGLLIPAWIITTVAGMLLFVDNVQGEFIPLYIMMAVALPFLFGGLTSPRRRALLIPGGILTLVGVLPLAVSSVEGPLVGPMVMVIIALPFLASAAWSRKNWWAIIPTGILVSIAAAMLVSGVTSGPDEAGLLLSAPASEEAKAGIFMGVMLLGWAAAFGILWLMRHTSPTHWASYPAIALALAGLFSLTLGANAMNIVGPALLIAGGILVLVRNRRRSQVV